ncbi:MAG: thymidylate kinase, partial [Pseudarthrobacter sp.]|nr:thymidylate kinase [Pseudarthrobacter sp.]
NMTLPAVHHSTSRLDFRSASALVVVLLGIDGAGKTTAAHALGKLLAPCTPTLVLANYSGRRTMTAWAESLGLTVPPRMLDLAESFIRSVNVVANHVRARHFDGVVIMDRHLHCQQALRAARGLPSGWFLRRMTRLVPPADAVVFLDVSPEEAHRRIIARGTDTETLEDLRAYRDGYLGLPSFDGFHRVTADAPLLAVLDDLEEVVSQSCRARTTAHRTAGANVRTFPTAVRHSRGTATLARVELNR